MTFCMGAIADLKMHSLMICWAMVSCTVWAQTHAQFERQQHCDIPGHDIEAHSVADVQSCQELCAGEGRCEAFVYISGWNRCQLKSSGKKRFAVQLYSAEIEEQPGKGESSPPEQGSGSRRFGAVRAGYDHKARDLKQVSPSDSIEHCQESCMKEPGCRAGTYIDGYRVCWLKSGPGSFQAKTFTCGFLKESKGP